MGMRIKHKKDRKDVVGFTLVELMIVIVIMVILAAAAVPLFNGYVIRTKKAVCMTKLSSVSQWLVVEKLMDPDLNAEKAQEQMEKELEGQKLCPSGGKYEIGNSNGNLVVSCSYHGKTPPQVVGDNIESLMGKGSAFRTKLDEYFNRVNQPKNLDSTGPNHGGDLKKMIADQLKISEKFEFRVWWGRGANDNYEIYIFDTIDGRNAGDTVEATKYYVSQDGKLAEVTGGKNPVKGTANLTLSQTEDSSGKLVEFLTLKGDSFQGTK